MWPKRIADLLGAGGTHGELCVRFGSEDLREPIIRDNLLDDDILREHMEKHRLEEWFVEACKAGKKAFEARRGQQQQFGRLQGLSFDGPDDYPQAQEEDGEAMDAEQVNGEEEVLDVPGSDSFEGDVESVADQDQDAEMLYS